MSCILSPVAPWPNQAAVRPTYTPRYEPGGLQTAEPMPLLYLGFPLSRSTCLLPASFLQSTPTPLCPLTTTRAPRYPVEGEVVRVPATLGSASPQCRKPRLSLCHREIGSPSPLITPKNCPGEREGPGRQPATDRGSGSRNPCRSAPLRPKVGYRNLELQPRGMETREEPGLGEGGGV